MRGGSALAFLLAVGFAVPGGAQTSDSQAAEATAESNEAPGQEGGVEAGSAEGALTAQDQAFLRGEEAPPEIDEPAEDPRAGWLEPPDQRYWMVGARWRLIMVPNWLLDAFLDFPRQGGKAPFVVNQSAGAEFTTRKNRFSITGAVWWASYSSHGAFVATETGDVGDPEYVDSSLQFLFLTVDFVHSYMFTDWFGITYGAGLGLGIRVAGAVERDEAFYAADDSVQHCGQPGGPGNTQTAFCENREEGWYQETEDRVWAVYPWINLLLGLRFKAFRHLEINVDGGVGLGFLFGVRVNYII